MRGREMRERESRVYGCVSHPQKTANQKFISRLKTYFAVQYPTSFVLPKNLKKLQSSKAMAWNQEIFVLVLLIVVSSFSVLGEAFGLIYNICLRLVIVRKYNIMKNFTMLFLPFCCWSVVVPVVYIVVLVVVVIVVCWWCIIVYPIVVFLVVH